MVVWVKEREGPWAIAKIAALSFNKERVGEFGENLRVRNKEKDLGATM